MDYLRVSQETLWSRFYCLCVTDVEALFREIITQYIKVRAGLQPGLSESRNRAANPCSRKVMVLWRALFSCFWLWLSLSWGIPGPLPFLPEAWATEVQKSLEDLFFAYRGMPAEFSGHTGGLRCCFLPPPVLRTCLAYPCPPNTFGPELLVSGSETLLYWNACGVLRLTAISHSSVIPLIRFTAQKYCKPNLIFLNIKWSLLCIKVVVVFIDIRFLSILLYIRLGQEERDDFEIEGFPDTS